MFSRNVLATLTLALFACGCNTEESDRLDIPPARDTEHTTSAVTSAEAYIFSARWPTQSDTSIADSTTAVAAQLGAPLNKADVLELLHSKSGAPNPFGRVGSATGGDVIFSYRRAGNDLRVSQEMRSIFSGSIVPEPMARATAESVVTKLAAAGILEQSKYQLSPSLSLVKTGHGANGQIVEERIDEFHYVYQRTINRIPFPNAGVKIAISSSGSVRLIRLGGAEVFSHERDGREVPLNSAPKVVLDVTEGQALARFTSEQPAAKIFSSTIAYTFNAARTEIEPRLLISFAETSTVGADIAFSRRRRMAYPLRTGGEVVDYTPLATPEATGDAKPTF